MFSFLFMDLCRQRKKVLTGWKKKLLIFRNSFSFSLFLGFLVDRVSAVVKARYKYSYLNINYSARERIHSSESRVQITATKPLMLCMVAQSS